MFLKVSDDKVYVMLHFVLCYIQICIFWSQINSWYYIQKDWKYNFLRQEGMRWWENNVNLTLLFRTGPYFKWLIVRFLRYDLEGAEALTVGI